jgi:hypothetical protein
MLSVESRTEEEWNYDTWLPRFHRRINADQKGGIR